MKVRFCRSCEPIENRAHSGEGYYPGNMQLLAWFACILRDGNDLLNGKLHAQFQTLLLDLKKGISQNPVTDGAIDLIRGPHSLSRCNSSCQGNWSFPKCSVLGGYPYTPTSRKR